MRPRIAASVKMEEFEALCRRQGVALTVQRRAVLEALTRRHDHPTADQVFADVASRLPEVSRTTVYRNLETLVEFGVARKVCHPGAAARFEAETHRHHHLVCLHCGKMIDLEDPRLDTIRFPNEKARGFEFADYSIQFRGTCRDCARADAPGRQAEPKAGKSRKKGRGSK